MILTDGEDYCDLLISRHDLKNLGRDFNSLVLAVPLAMHGPSKFQINYIIQKFVELCEGQSTFEAVRIDMV